jgi:hypothetical protein
MNSNNAFDQNLTLFPAALSCSIFQINSLKFEVNQTDNNTVMKLNYN